MDKNEDYINYKNSEEYKNFKIEREKNKCKECGGTNHYLEKHKESCSQYRHFVDDHYDSACMLGRCKHCNPEYIEKRTMQVTEEEREIIEKLRKNP